MRTNASTPNQNCQHCNVEFKPKSGSVGKFCSIKCKCEKQKHDKIYGKSERFRCAVCHALIGLGIEKSGNLIGIRKQNISIRLKAAGIKRYEPEGGTWLLSAARLRRKEKAWQDAYMSEYDFKFPEWRRSDFAPLISQYQMMSQEQRDAHNKKTADRVRNCIKSKARQKEWRDNNKDYVKEKHKQWMKTTKGAELLRKYRKYPVNRIKSNLRKRMRDLLRNARDEKMSVSGLIGCTSFQFKEYLEQRFKRGMTWDNYGTYWHVDHILPCASFDHTDKKQVAQCWHYTNLRPLRALENMIKSDTITEPQMSLLL